MSRICPFISTVYKSVGGDSVLIPYYCIGNSCQLWDDVNGRCGALTTDILVHNHNSHQHPRSHTCAQSKGTTFYYNYCGGNVHGQLIPRATLLMNEFMFKEDTDNNGYLYGDDFMIYGEDKPLILDQLENMEQWVEPSCKITWQQYINWIENLDESSYNPFLNGTCG